MVKRAKMRKRMGRPPTGTLPLVAVRFPAELIARIDAFAKEQKVSRSTALRALVTEALDKRKS
jgi:metal-responsive CopG/Arc/MetJ family transcriptional regulator